MLFVYWACIADSDTALNQQRVKLPCSLGTVNVLLFDKRLFVYSNVEKRKCASTQVHAEVNKCARTAQRFKCARRKCTSTQIHAQVCKCASGQVSKCSSTCARPQVRNYASVQVLAHVLAQVHKCVSTCTSAQVRKCASEQVLAQVRK